LNRSAPGRPGWLSRAVFYQVYPQSFCDSNGDGVGDLRGIAGKLDYLQWLGCNAIWLNPCFESPFEDAGYDVSDYRRVAPRYGTNADMKRLFVEARRRGIRVCLDLVAGHTSIRHPWFRRSCSARTNRYSDWYIWTSSIRERVVDGLSTVSGYGDRAANYVPNFFYFQPSLNYGFADPESGWQLPTTHPGPQAVRAEMKRVMRFWLDMGADGFRVDMAFSLVKGDHDGQATADYWREVRAMMDRDYPDAALLSEWGYPSRAIPAGFHVDFWLAFFLPGYLELFRKEAFRSMRPNGTGHSFFDSDGLGDVSAFARDYVRERRRTNGEGYIAIPTGNHDVTRISLGRSRKELELIFAFVLTMPGLPFIYYGDEIGMRYLPHLPSKEGGYHRTGSRTPMQWNSTKNAGFSSAAGSKLYLPIDPCRDRPTVAAQQADERSLLSAVQRLVQLRLRFAALGADGDFEPLLAQPNAYPFVYLRRSGTELFLVALNPSGATVAADLDAPCHAPPGGPVAGSGVSLSPRSGRLHLEMRRVSYGVFRLQGC
jgi:glycosidase